MAIYKRGKFYWYKFMWRGELVRESTHQGNDNVARNMEAKHRTRLADEDQEREAARERLGCSDVLRCHECEKLFNADGAIREGTKVYCSDACCSTWAKKHTRIPTLAEFIEKRFEPWARATFEHTSPKTWQGWYRTSLKTLKSTELLCALKIDAITGEQVAEFAAKRQADGLQASSVNACLRVLRRLLRIAAEWGVIEHTPKVKLLRGERHRERVVTPEEEARYLAAAPDLLAAVATVLVDTGMRPEECFRLRWESLTWVNGRNGSLLVTHGKTAAARRLIPMTSRVRHTLETRWKAQEKPAEGWVWSAPTKSGHIESCSLKKQHAGTFKTVNKEVQEHNAKATTEAEKQKPLKPWVLYSFRHTFLTRLGESGCDAWTLARIAGHSNISISQRYVHPSENAVLNAFTRLGGHKIGHTPALQQ
jgi:integrase